MSDAFGLVVIGDEILKVGIGWGSQFGGAPQSLEQAIHIYQGGLPNPGAPIFTLPGPLLNDGFINEFDLELIPGNKVIPSGPFTVTLEFLNQNAGDIFAPSVRRSFHDLAQREDFFERILNATCSGGPGPTNALQVLEDIAAAVVYLASDAAAYVTGETLNINGGLHMS